MTFIPKVFEVSGLVTLAFLRDEATLLLDGPELRVCFGGLELLWMTMNATWKELYLRWIHRPRLRNMCCVERIYHIQMLRQLQELAFEHYQ
ncbi:unnamed protein product [Calypogeia fissa]